MKACQIFVAVIASLCLSPICTSFAFSPIRTVAQYRVSFKGFSIGDVVTTQAVSEDGGNNRVEFETRASIKASLLWMGYQLSSVEKGTLENGALVSYSRKWQENGAKADVAGRLEKSGFRFDIHEHGIKRSVVIPRSDYDYTTMECPEARIDFSVKPLITLRILDVEKMAVVIRDYHLVRNTRYEVSGKEFPCRIVDFSDQNKKARRWISWDGTAVVIYRQDFKGEKHSYSLRSTSITKDQKITD